jgi:nucleoid DNA-binding protein
MKLKDLIAIVATVTDSPDDQVREVLETALQVMADALSDHEPVRLPGLGRLEVRQVGIPRIVCLAPYSQKREIAPHAVRFRAVKRLRNEVNIRAAYK